LSWQQRRRPLSQIAAENSRSFSPKPSATDQTPSEENEASRAQIAQSLGGKDPSWFKQTSDRGIGSAALRKSQEASEETSLSAGKFKLPGLSQEKPESLSGTMSPPMDVPRSISPSRSSSVRGSWSNRYSSATSASDAPSAAMKSPLILDPPRLVPGREDSPAPLGQRPPSPTKGMGGFVQSAMLRRSESVNKRWSAQGPPSLSRNTSTASSRSGYSGRGDNNAVAATQSRFDTRPSSLSRGNSLEPSSRPSSSHSSQTITQHADQDKDTGSRPAPLMHSRSKSMASLKNITKAGEDAIGDLSSPPSPSKRWSSTKSSWLETKLSKTDEKPKPAPLPAQPSWMSDIAKAKQQRMSASIDDPPKVLAADTSLPKSPSKFVSDPYLPKTVSPELKPVSKPEPKPEFAPPALQPSVSAPEPAPKPLGLAQMEPAPSTSLRTATPPALSPKPAESKPIASSGRHDFRANLKPRVPPPGAGKNDEPEFKNALGKLRRTQTEKYVAPDLLKDNITRGKAGLNITGGPARREKVDEFKDSLIRQKAAMQAKAPDSSGPQSIADKPKPTPATPEALAKRNAMHRTQSTASSSDQKEATPEPVARQRSLNAAVATTPKPTIPPKPLSPPAKVTPAESPRTAKKDLGTWTKEETVLAKKAEPVEESKPVALPGLKSGASSKLAQRFNPGLAGLLARGPPATAPSSGSSKDSGANELCKTSSDGPLRAGAELTHMTKGRAKGPKRRAPKATSSAEPATKPAAEPTIEKTVTRRQPILDSKIEEKPTPKPERKEALAIPFAKKLESTMKARPLPTPPSSTAQLPNVPLVKQENILPSNEIGVNTAPSTPSQKEKPIAPAKSPLISFKPAENSTSAAPVIESSDLVSMDIESMLAGIDLTTDNDPVKKSSTPKALSLEKATASPKPASTIQEKRSSVSVKDVAARWSNSAEPPAPSSPLRPRSPIKLPSWHDDGNSQAGPSPKPRPAEPEKHKKPIMVGLGLSNVGSTKEQPSPLPKKLPMSPPSSAGFNPKPDTNASQSSIGATKPRPPSLSVRSPPPSSPNSQSVEAARLFAEFFNAEPSIESAGDVDVGELLDASPLAQDKVSTLSKQINFITNDGKLQPLPGHQQHILFEDSMYVCTHTFQPPSGSKSTEVYLWAGAAVAPGAVEDAQLFARKVAKDNGSRLIVLRQGKEPPNFFQALGGIVVTFKANHSSSGANGLPEQFILCGRRHLGHIAFDEVEFARSSFCTGFPYLVSSNNKLYLWKGEGCNVDELSCARLIAMDIGPTPDVVELSEGSEPASFLELFPLRGRSKSTAIPPSATHWRLKPSIGEKYRARLFRIEQHAQAIKKTSAFQVSNFLSAVGSFLPVVSSSSRPVSPVSPASSRADPLENNFTETRSSKSILSSPAASRSPVAGSSSGGQVSINVEELVPFSWDDIDGEAVWVLDAFFEVYM
jgi:hypothetical protein